MIVATVLTVYGIETLFLSDSSTYATNVATVLTVYGIETIYANAMCYSFYLVVATVLTVYGIETLLKWLNLCQKQHF